MCRAYVVHFSHHDVRPLMTAKPRGYDGQGDFIDPVDLTRCECNTWLDISWPEPTNYHRPGIEPPLESFDQCPDHHCCAIWDHVVLCPWSYQFVMNGGPNINPHMECPNMLTTHKYHPVQTAMAPDPVTGDWAQPIWKEDDLPTFPVDMFYSHHVQGNDQDTHRIARDVLEMFEVGQVMKAGKRSVLDGLRLAEDGLSHELKNMTEPEHLRGNRQEKLAAGLRSVKKALRHINILLKIIDQNGWLLGKMLSIQHSALELLNRLPEKGAVATSADGSYQVSREMLELAAEDKEAFVAEARESYEWKLAMSLRSAFVELRTKLRARLDGIEGGNVAARKRGQQDCVNVEARKSNKKKRSRTTSSGGIGGWSGQASET